MIALKGRVVPLITPFTDDGSMLSEVRISKLVRYVTSFQAPGIVLCSDTGEGWRLNVNDRKAIFEQVMRDSQNALGVLVNVTCMSTLASLDLAQHAGRHGALGVVLEVPPDPDLDSEEIEKFVQTVAQYSNLPLIFIDRDQRLSKPALLRVRELPEVFIGSSLTGTEHEDWGTQSGRVTSDEFVCGDVVVSPLFLLHLSQPPADSKKAVYAKHGSAKVAKAALMMRDMEVGYPRAPHLALRGEQIDEVNRLFLG